MRIFSRWLTHGVAGANGASIFLATLLIPHLSWFKCSRIMSGTAGLWMPQAHRNPSPAFIEKMQLTSRSHTLPCQLVHFTGSTDRSRRKPGLGLPTARLMWFAWDQKVSAYDATQKSAVKASSQNSRPSIARSSTAISTTRLFQRSWTAGQPCLDRIQRTDGVPANRPRFSHVPPCSIRPEHNEYS